MTEPESSAGIAAPRRITRSCRIAESFAGSRLDQVLSQLFPEYSRSRIQQWIRAGGVRVDGRPCAPRQRLAGGERVELAVELEPAVDEHRAQPVAFELVHRDDALIVVNKPAGLVVHPAAGNPDRTLMNGLLHLDPGLALLPRAGIVHRLDKDTSGLLVVARTLQAHRALVAALAARRVHREYLALVRGEVVAGGTVEAPVGRHPVDRKRMAVVAGGRAARTHYRVSRRLRGFTLLQCILDTGRTHQIRVHMAHIGHPLVGDPVYGGRLQLPAAATPAQAEALRGFRRQALHAARLSLEHPSSHRSLAWEAGLPADFATLLECLSAPVDG